MASKVLGIRLRTDSSLPERLKKLADMAQVPYCDLLEKWVEMAERGEIPGQIPSDFIEETTSTDAGKLAEILTRIENLEGRTGNPSEARPLAEEFADLRLNAFSTKGTKL